MFRAISTLAVSMTGGALLLYVIEPDPLPPPGSVLLLQGNRPGAALGVRLPENWDHIRVRVVRSAATEDARQPHFTITPDGRLDVHALTTETRPGTADDVIIDVVVADGFQLSIVQFDALETLLARLRGQYDVPPDHVRFEFEFPVTPRASDDRERTGTLDGLSFRS